MTELQEPLEEGTNAVHRLRRSRMYLGEDGNGGHVQVLAPGI